VLEAADFCSTVLGELIPVGRAASALCSRREGEPGKGVESSMYTRMRAVPGQPAMCESGFVARVAMSLCWEEEKDFFVSCTLERLFWGGRD
jgi:hypothetical protein